MGREITYDCNASTERVIRSKDSQGVDRNISKDSIYFVFFDMTAPDTASEKRKLRAVHKQTGATVIVDLNDDAGGRKPIDTGAQHKPLENPNPRYGVKSDVATERVFYADENLSATSGIRVLFKIDPLTGSDDKMRYLLFSGNVPADLANRRIQLNSDGGKKPLSAGTDLRKLLKALSKQFKITKRKRK